MTNKESRQPVIPDCNELFDRFLVPHYGADQRPRLRGDIEQLRKPGSPASSLCRLTEEGLCAVANQVRVMVESAQSDWSRYLKVKGKPDLKWIDAFDRHYDRAAIRRVIDRSDPADFSNDYLVLCCEFGAMIGFLMVESTADCEWVYAMPYWESVVYHAPTGSEIPVFHWAVKKMSDYGADDGIAEKIPACLQLLARGL